MNVIVANEVVLEDEAGRERANRQDIERDQHEQRQRAEDADGHGEPVVEHREGLIDVQDQGRRFHPERP